MNHQTAKIIAEEYYRQTREIWNNPVEADESHLQVARVRHMFDHAAVWERVTEALRPKTLEEIMKRNPDQSEVPHVP